MKLKKFIYDENRPPIFYREGTSDTTIIESILVNQQEYFFPIHNFKPKIIWDIGANIGVVSYIFAMIYPEARIYAFEPQKENFEILRLNTKDLPNVTIFNVGLGDMNDRVFAFPSEDETNHGGFSAKIESTKPTQEIEIVKTKLMLEKLGAPELIKIDTEGSEYAILNSFSDEDLEKVKFIAGELHGVNDYLLLNRLDKHFKLKLARHFDSKNWHFHAALKTWTDLSENLEN